MIELAALVWPAFAGALVGTLVGVLPGIGPAAAMALLLPLTFGMEPSAALVMLSGIYFGSQYGSSTTAILMNLPGEASGVVTAEEGHRMACAGRAGPALAIAALSSFFAGLVAAGVVFALTPFLARVAVAMSPAMIAGVVLAAAVAMIVVSRAGLAKGFAMLLLGVAIGLVGTDFGGGLPRFTFGLSELRDGVGLTPLVVGLFGLGELAARWPQLSAAGRIAPVGRLVPSAAEMRQALVPAVRGTAIGALIGALPGGSTLLASAAAQGVEKRFAADRARYGAGAVSGVAAPEAANNAAAQTGLVPLIGLGLPGNAVMAVMLGALMLHGLPPGPALFQRHPEVFEALIGGMLIANLALLILNLPLVGLWAQILRLPLSWLAPLIVLMSAMGVYAQSRSPFDVGLMALFGLVGFVLSRGGFPLAPVVFGAVLGPLFEDHVRRALMFGLF
jgi:putative tricarboxylic transport membrane protein